MTSVRRKLLVLIFAAFGLAPAFAHAAGNEILWDRYGVAHVYARSTDDLFFGYGWAQTKSHGDALLKLYAEARGRAAEVWGPAEAVNDRWMAINAVPERTRDWLARQTPEFRAHLAAFARGINAYAAAHPDTLSPQARKVLPVSAADVLGHSLRLFQYVYLAPPTIVDKLPAPAEEPKEPQGSNGWAIAPARSTSGHAMLLMNPHLPWGTGWSTYYEIQLKAPGVDLYGASQVGLPVLRFLFSDYLGFTQTVNYPNNVTLYRITSAPGGYRFDGKVLPFKVSHQTIKILQPDGSLKTESIEVRSTVQGPIVAETGGAPVAMRVAGLDRPKALEQYWRMGTAHDFAGYEAAQRMQQVPSFNVVYADRDGHIQYLFNGLVPKKQGRDLKYWAGLVPGDRSDTLWTSYLPRPPIPRAGRRRTPTIHPGTPAGRRRKTPSPTPTRSPPRR